MDIFKLLANLLAMTVMAPRRGGDNNNNGTLSFEQQYAGPVSSLPEETMNTPEMIRYQGYPVEVHETSTADGYVLELHRIPLGRNATNDPAGPTRPVVFLQHGLLGSSADWTMNLAEQSAAFVFADAGFDVWLGNSRGNVYSRGHKNLSCSDKQYWQFSWDEMAEHDLEVAFNKALDVTGAPNLYYVGHSQGTEIMFARLAAGDTGFNQKLRAFFALAPVSTVGHIRGLFAWLGTRFGDHSWLLRMLFGEGEFLPYSWLLTYFARIVCEEPAIINPLCRNILFQIGGPERGQFNNTRLPIYLAHVPAGTSTQNIMHWSQMVHSKQMQKYDYGTEAGNQEHYGQPSPPLYNVSRLAVPTYVFYSPADWLADPLDVQTSLLDRLEKRWVRSVVQLPGFNHFDFIWGERAPTLVYAQIVRAIVTDLQQEQNVSGHASSSAVDISG